MIQATVIDAADEQSLPLFETGPHTCVEDALNAIRAHIRQSPVPTDELAASSGGYEIHSADGAVVARVLIDDLT
ncbi:hypothetical protein [Gordonia malaquae]|uniref:hypothetical protein n=1 Tax=Gordonia malaquae TaxID=410332 RepID=UPI00301AFE07